MQHVVGGFEGFVERDLVAEHFHQLVVRHHDQRVDVGRERLDAFVRDALALALERERLRHHRDREDAELLGELRHDRGRAGAGAPAHARRQEQHVRAGDGFGDTLAVFQRRLTPDLGVGPRAQPLGDAAAQLQLQFRGIALERLGVGVGADELHPLHALLDHVVDRVAAAAADADHLDYGLLPLCVHYFKHASLLSSSR